MRTRLVASVLALALGSAVVPSLASAVVPTKESKSKPDNTFSLAFDARLGDEEVPGKSLAIAAFEAAFGDLPGKTVKKLPRRRVDDTLALYALTAAWDALSPAQQRAANRRLDRFDGDGPLVNIDAANGPAGGSSVGLVNAALLARIRAAREEVARHLAPLYGLPVERLASVETTVRAHEYGASEGSVRYYDSTRGPDYLIPNPGGGFLIPGDMIPNACLLMVNETREPTRQQLVTLFRQCMYTVVPIMLRRMLLDELIVISFEASWVFHGGRQWIDWHVTRNTGWFRQPTLGIADYGAAAFPFYALLEADGLDPEAVRAAQIRAVVAIPYASDREYSRALVQQRFTAAFNVARSMGFEGATRIGLTRLRDEELGVRWTPLGITVVDVPRVEAEPIDGSRSAFRSRSLDMSLRGTATETYRLDVRNTEVLEVLFDAPANMAARIGFRGMADVALGRGQTTLFCLRGTCACPPTSPTPRMQPGRGGDVGIAVGNEGTDLDARTRAALRFRVRTLTDICPPAPVITVPITDDDVTPPVLSKLSASPSEISEVQCPPSEAGISVVATDESGIASVTMSWAFEAGFGHQSGSVEMTRSGESQFSATFGPYDIAVTTDVALSITAIDTYGNPTTELVSVALLDCPV